MATMRRRALLTTLIGGAAFARSARAATSLPAGPVRLIVAYPQGGISDLVTRMLAEHLALQIGWPVRVENLAGAGGSIALHALARSEPDGRTLVFSAITPLAFEPSLARFGEPQGITPLASVMLTPSLLVGTPAFQGHRFDDLLALARENPGSLRWATSGIATTGHLVLEQICRSFDIVVTHVPYKGGGQQLNDALGGQFELLATNVGPTQLPYVRAGRFKPLAVGAPSRLGVLPDVPTLAELGCPNGNLASLFGLFAQGSTPPAMLRGLNDAVNQALRQAAVGAMLIASGNLPTGGSVQDFNREIARATEGIGRLLKHD